MIISHRYKYVFVEFPQTGCSAVAKELMEQYEGQRILFKHAQYHEFLRQASPAERTYFSFSTVRNPLDVVVSKYFKYQTDHENYAHKKVKHGKLRKYIMPGLEARRFQFVTEQQASFEAFFLKYYKWPYSAWSILGHHKLDFVMKFDHLAEDFSTALKKIGIEQKRELPLYNKTGARSQNFDTYYASAAARERAVRIFGPYMSQFGFEFPTAWPEKEEVLPAHRQYAFVNFFRKAYWKYLR